MNESPSIDPSSFTLTDTPDFSSLSGSYTLDEVIEIEELAGRPIDQLMDGDWGRPMRAMAFVIGRRANPEFTLEDAGRIAVHLDITLPGA